MKVIGKASQLYSEVKFLSKAISKDDTRYFMGGIYNDVENNVTVSTDGRRLHILNHSIEGLEQGIWKVKVSASEILIYELIDGQFPNYQRVTPDEMPVKIEEFCISPKKPFEEKDTIDIFHLYNKGACLNLNYIKDIGGYCWKVSFGEPDKAIVFETGILKAVIMPMECD